MRPGWGYHVLKGKQGQRGQVAQISMCVCLCVNVCNSNYLHTNKNSDTQTHIDYRVQAIGINWPWLVPEVDIQSAYHLFTSPWLPRRLYENPHRTELTLTVPLYALYNFICIYMNAKMCFLFVLIKLTLVFRQFYIHCVPNYVTEIIHTVMTMLISYRTNMKTYKCVYVCVCVSVFIVLCTLLCLSRKAQLDANLHTQRCSYKTHHMHIQGQTCSVWW